MENKIKVNPEIINIAQDKVREYLENGSKGALMMPPPLESLYIVINEEPESFLVEVPVSNELEKSGVKSIYILTSRDIKKPA